MTDIAKVIAEIRSEADISARPGQCERLNAIADRIAALRASRQEPSDELKQWRELHKSIIELGGFSPDWPSHGNAPLAIAASYALLQMQLGKAVNNVAPPEASRQEPVGWVPQSEIDHARRFGGGIHVRTTKERAYPVGSIVDVYAAPVAPATECPVCAKRQKFSIAVLPKITAEIISEFGEVSLIEYDKAGEAQWTQDAVDFAALVAGHLTCPIGSEFDKPIGWKFKYKESDDWSYTENAKAAKRYREREYFVQAVYDRKPAPVADAPARVELSHVVPSNCRQRLKAEGKPYPRSSCASCGSLSPNWRQCDAVLCLRSQGSAP